MKADIFKDIPHSLYDGDITSDYMTSAEVHALADELLRRGFAEIKKKYAQIILL